MAVDPNDPRFWGIWNSSGSVPGGGNAAPYSPEPPLVPGYEGYGPTGPIWGGLNDIRYAKNEPVSPMESQPYYDEYGNVVPRPNYQNDSDVGPFNDWEQQASWGPAGSRAAATDLYVTPYDAPVSLPYAPPGWPYEREPDISAAHGPQPDGTGDWEQNLPPAGFNPGGPSHYWNDRHQPPRPLKRPPTGIPWLDQLQPGEQVDW